MKLVSSGYSSQGHCFHRGLLYFSQDPIHQQILLALSSKCPKNLTTSHYIYHYPSSPIHHYLKSLLADLPLSTFAFPPFHSHSSFNIQLDHNTPLAKRLSDPPFHSASKLKTWQGPVWFSLFTSDSIFYNAPDWPYSNHTGKANPYPCQSHLRPVFSQEVVPLHV